MRRRTRLAVSVLPTIVAVACSDPAAPPTVRRFPSAPLWQLTLNGGASVNTPGKPTILEMSDGTAFVTVPSRDQDRVFHYRLDRTTGSLTFIRTVLTGDGPVVATRARGRHQVVVNSLSNDLSVLRGNESGGLTEIGRVPSGGIVPSDAEPLFEDLIIVANRGALTGEGEGVTLFSVDAHGTMSQVGELTPSGPQPPAILAGNDPHIISVGGSGLVAVANSSSNDVTLFKVTRAGEMTVKVPSVPVGGSPKAMAFHGNHTLFVGVRAPVFGASQDVIKTYSVEDDGSVQQIGTSNAGWFLTDLEARDDKLFAATWPSPSTPTNEVWVFDISGKRPAVFLESRTIPGAPSFQQLTTAAPIGGVFDIAVTAFQGATLRWLQHQ